MCTPGEEENLEDMLESHEFRRPGDGEADFGRLPFAAAILSLEGLFLERPGLLFGMGLGAEGSCSAEYPLLLWAFFVSLSDVLLFR